MRGVQLVIPPERIKEKKNSVFSVRLHGNSAARLARVGVGGGGDDEANYSVKSKADGFPRGHGVRIADPRGFRRRCRRPGIPGVRSELSSFSQTTRNRVEFNVFRSPVHPTPSPVPYTRRTIAAEARDPRKILAPRGRNHDGSDTVRSSFRPDRSSQ